ncbi:MAG TPA: exodeoxyribonuclease VII small subunit [Candidatus Limnocylindria bacterium]|nr:exodeoxyribonuclease VII small subunit [Candidatus Limnocylindria bacterium]
MVTADEIVNLPFDELLAELQRIVVQLEAGNAPLEESIALYRRALALHAAAEQRLQAAELTITQIGAGIDAAAPDAAAPDDGDAGDR